MFTLTDTVLGRFWVRFIDYLPDFFGGLLIFIVGIVLASILKRLFLTLLKFFRVEGLLEKAKLMPKNETALWEEILAEILKWTIVILFLVPTLEAWRLSQATMVINQLIFYLPNVIVAVIIGFVGIITANLVADLVRHTTKSIGETTAGALAAFSKSLMIFFTVLVIMNQLGVAQDLIRILFTGIIVMLALAGGLAFGLGGRDMAKEILEGLRKRLK